jgi:hypothetical protein
LKEADSPVSLIIPDDFFAAESSPDSPPIRRGEDISRGNFYPVSNKFFDVFQGSLKLKVHVTNSLGDDYLAFQSIEKLTIKTWDYLAKDGF